MIPFTGTSQAWNEILVSLPHAATLQKSHYMQTWQWSLAKARTGWQPMPFIWLDEAKNPAAAAMILKRPIPIRGLSRRICVLYIPRGPLMNWDDANLRTRVLHDVEDFTRKQGAIYVKIDPDVSLGTGALRANAGDFPGGLQVCSDLKQRGWQYSKEQVQPFHTILVDLTASEDAILSRMKQKTRYNIRLAQKKGVTVRKGTEEDFLLMFQMINETSERDRFGIRDEGHYRHMWQSFPAVDENHFNHQPFMENLIAEVEGEVVAAVSLFFWGDHATYLYGMSRAVHREKMPNYLLQWEAMRRARELGCTVYDTYGITNTFKEGSLLWNVYRFKDGFGGEVYRGIAAWDFTPSPILYRLYMDVLPLIRQTLGIHGPPYTNIEERHERSLKNKRKHPGEMDL